MLLMMIAIGVISACMAGASRGNRIAFGLSVAIIGTVLPFAVFTLVHWFSFALASLPLSINRVNQLNYSTPGSLPVNDHVDDSPETDVVPADTDPEQTGNVDA